MNKNPKSCPKVSNTVVWDKWVYTERRQQLNECMKQMNKWVNQSHDCAKYILTFNTFFPNNKPQDKLPPSSFSIFPISFRVMASPVWSKCSLALGVWSHSCRTCRWQLVQFKCTQILPQKGDLFAGSEKELKTWPKIRCHGNAWDEQTLQDLQSGVIKIYTVMSMVLSNWTITPI